MAESNTSGGRWWVLALKNQLWLVEWQVSSLKTRATWATQQTLKEGQKLPRSGDDLALLSFDLATFGLPLLKSAQIWPRSTIFLA